jgi:FkbM family methyltransferase
MPQPAAPAVPLVPFATIVPTLYGPMLINRHDINQTNSLYKTGLALEHADIILLTQLLSYLGTDLTFVDVGANFGTFALGLARALGPNGKVHAFEPQRIIYNLLVGSVALNSLTNVYCYNVALGNTEGQVEIPQFDYNQPMNFGSVEFTPDQIEPLHQIRGHDPAKSEFVPLKTIDSFNFPKLNIMKVDTEGMELEVLQGAVQTIRRCRPLLYVEFLKGNREALGKAILALDYAVHQNGNNLLCIPTELASRIPIARAP